MWLSCFLPSALGTGTVIEPGWAFEKVPVGFETFEIEIHTLAISLGGSVLGTINDKFGLCFNEDIRPLPVDADPRVGVLVEQPPRHRDHE